MIYLTVILSAIVLGLLVYRYDLYDREPVVLLLLTFLIGFVVMRAAGYLEDDLLRALDDGIPPTWLLAVVAAAVEESFKLAITVGIAVVFFRHFNDPMDGLIYGAFAGLGMALEESFHYLSLGSLEGDAAGQEMVRLLAHHLMGGIAGFEVGMARFQMRRWPAVLAGCFLVSFTLHALWDVASGIQLERLSADGYPRAASIVLMIVAVSFFGYLVSVAARWSRERFAPGDRRSPWAWPFTLLIRKRGG